MRATKSAALAAVRAALASFAAAAALAGASLVSPAEAGAACTPGEPYVDDVTGIRYVCSEGMWEAAGDVSPSRLGQILRPPHAFLPGRYAVPAEMPRGIWMSSTREGAYPPCMYITRTHDDIPVDAIVGDFDGGPLYVKLYSPAIASFYGSDNCTPWVRVE